MGARYIIRVPKRTILDRISSSNGPIHALDIEGAARLKTSNGGVRAENLQGNLDAQTSNAGIDVQNLEGSASLHTSNGRVHAEEDVYKRQVRSRTSRDRGSSAIRGPDG